jgi:hypothetical protein
VRALWFRKCASFEEEAEADREYWAQFTPDEKVALIEDLKRESAMISNQGYRPSVDHVEFVACLNRQDARFLIIGAHAIAFHARPRNTKDFDVLIEPTRENAKRILAALADFGFGSLNITEMDLATLGEIVQLGFPPNRIDIVNHISGVSFDEAWAGRVEGRFGTERAFFIGKAELIRNKESVARPQDLADADLLRRT